jgi:hypothetical protein
LKGLQVHAYEIYDEGADSVVQNARKFGNVNAIFPTANYTSERHPCPRGLMSRLEVVIHLRDTLIYGTSEVEATAFLSQAYA